MPLAARAGAMRRRRASVDACASMPTRVSLRTNPLRTFSAPFTTPHLIAPWRERCDDSSHESNQQRLVAAFATCVVIVSTPAVFASQEGSGVAQTPEQIPQVAAQQTPEQLQRLVAPTMNWSGRFSPPQPIPIRSSRPTGGCRRNPACRESSSGERSTHNLV